MFKYNALPMRLKIVAGNWKMNSLYDEGLKLASEVFYMVESELIQPNIRVIIAPPFTHLSAISRIMPEHFSLGISAQDCSAQAQGAYTGEVSAQMIRSVGAQYVIIGHSERRAFHSEDYDLLARKLDQALAADLIPIFCCGEPLEIREAGTEVGYVQKQIEDSTFHLSAIDFSKLVIAYEPVWAIGTGRTASAQQAQEMHKSIRAMIAAKYGQEIADNCSILYGGSCKPDNAESIFNGADVDGGLIGGASLNSRDFIDIVKALT
jgi:triosephosphate isomerase (TIM)